VTILLTTINAKWIHPSLALRLLKANLSAPKGGPEPYCEIIEFALRQPLTEKIEAIRAARPRILGISVSIWNHRATLELLEALAQEYCASTGDRLPLVVLGGPEASFLPGDSRIFRHADYVIRGEGETAFRELCEELLNDDKRPLAAPKALLRSTRLVDAAPVDLSQLRQAYHYYTDEDLKAKLVYVEASRGCAYHCDFCLSPQQSCAPPAGSGVVPAGAGPVREFPLEPFLAEMETLINRGARTFKFLDRSFNLNIKRAIAIMEFFLKHIEALARRQDAPLAAVSLSSSTLPLARPPRALCVHFEMVPGRFPPELRAVLRRFPPGSLRLEIGIQTLNPAVAALINRAQSGEGGEILEALEFLSGDTHAIIHADLIAALPGEDYDSFAAGFDKLWQALSGGSFAGSTGEGSARSLADNRTEIQLGILKLLPGAAMARHTAAFCMRYAVAPPYEALSTAALPERDLDRVKNFARFWELIMNRNSFPDITTRLFPPAEPVFQNFMELSDRLLARFGRNWGIDNWELRAALEVEIL
jgi:radical SAM superfamily enzyme YgiQ (UPF0313 family)